MQNTNTAPVVVDRKPQTGFELVRQETMGRRICINPKEERVTTVIGQNSHLIGDLRFKEGVKIDCSIKGTVTFGTEDGLCIVSKGAVVEGNIQGPRALILGTINGDIDTSGLLLLAPSAVVVGNVSYGRLIVCEGAQISGQMSAGAREPANFGGNVEALPIRNS